MCEISQSLKES